MDEDMQDYMRDVEMARARDDPEYEPQAHPHRRLARAVARAAAHDYTDRLMDEHELEMPAAAMNNTQAVLQQQATRILNKAVKKSSTAEGPSVVMASSISTAQVGTQGAQQTPARGAEGAQAGTKGPMLLNDPSLAHACTCWVWLWLLV